MIDLTQSEGEIVFDTATGEGVHAKSEFQGLLGERLYTALFSKVAGPACVLHVGLDCGGKSVAVHLGPMSGGELSEQGRNCICAMSSVLEHGGAVRVWGTDRKVREVKTLRSWGGTPRADVENSADAAVGGRSGSAYVPRTDPLTGIRDSF